MTESSIMIIGRSGSGKSFLLFRMCEYLAKTNKLHKEKGKSPFFVYNAKCSEYDPAIFNQLASLEDAEHLENCVLIIEDMICVDDRTMTQLRKLLDYSARHNNLYIFIITHTLIKNGVSSMLPSLGNVVFTKSPGLRKSFKLLVRDFGIAIDDSIWNDFVSHQDNYRYLALNLKNQNITAISENPGYICKSILSGGEKLEIHDAESELNKSMEKKRSKIKKISAGFSTAQQQKMLVIFDVLFESPESFEIMGNDCTIKFASSKGSHIKCNIIDLLWYITDESGSVPPKEVEVAFKILTEDKSIPQVLIKNPNLLKYL